MNESNKVSIFGREPVLYLAVIEAALALVAGFGFSLDGQQIALIMALAAAVLGFIARSQVTPTDKTQGDNARRA